MPDRSMLFDRVVTIIAGNEFELPSDIADAASQALFRLGAEIDSANWLDPGRAFDLPFASLDADQADAAIRQLVGKLPVDIIAQPLKGRRKHLLVADMESTLIHNEMLDELAAMAGCGPAIAAITQQAMNGEVDFDTAVKARVRLLAGLTVESLEEAASRIELVHGAAALIATMRRAGARTVMVSGGFDFFAIPVAKRLGLDEVHANRLAIEDGRLSGEVIEPLLGRTSKYEVMLNCAAGQSLPLAQILSVGDGANDLQMIEAAGLGVAFRAKPFLRERARWRIDHADLTALLFAQGYAKGEFIGSGSGTPG